MLPSNFGLRNVIRKVLKSYPGSGLPLDFWANFYDFQNDGEVLRFEMGSQVLNKKEEVKTKRMGHRIRLGMSLSDCLGPSYLTHLELLKRKIKKEKETEDSSDRSFSD